MITTEQQFSVLLDELNTSTWTLAAIGLLLESGLADLLREPLTLDELAARCPALTRDRIERCLAVAVMRGVVVVEGERRRLAPGVPPHLEPPLRAVTRGDYRSTLMQAAAYLDAPRGAGWHHRAPALLQAQGDGSSVFPTMFKARLVHQLGDLAGRLEQPGAAFLDVGVGVAALSIAMCRAFPQLRAVGLVTSEVPLALARANVAAAGLADRIELRQLAIQDLTEEAAYDLVWLPAFFLGPEAVRPAIARIRAALRPGGFLLTPALNPAAGEAQRAVFALIMESWGGPVLDGPEAEALLAEAGLTPRSFPGPSAVVMVAAQR